jgi:hypothetical protein
MATARIQGRWSVGSGAASGNGLWDPGRLRPVRSGASAARRLLGGGGRWDPGRRRPVGSWAAVVGGLRAVAACGLWAEGVAVPAGRCKTRGEGKIGDAEMMR